MRNKETGEFELMVGNGQLLSGFFILVLLLAVTFAMGYVVGQNSPRSAKATAEETGYLPRVQVSIPELRAPFQPYGYTGFLTLRTEFEGRRVTL